MKLPHALDVIIPQEKLSDYLLSESHPVGRFKAKFLSAYGFNQTNVDKLETQLRSMAQTAKVVEKAETLHGTKYILQGKITAPNGKRLSLQTIWIVETDQTIPRFVTAYPL